MRGVLPKLTEAFLDVLFPPLCLLCRRSLAHAEKLDFLCAACKRSIPLRDAFHCAICDARLPTGVKTCHPDAPYLLAAAAPYGDERVKRLVWQLKYEKRTAAARALGALVAEYFAPLARELGACTLVPIPLHPRRLRERGFNQSELIAEEVARRTGFKLRAGLLTRTRATKSQAECREREERTANIAGCFALQPAAALPEGRIALVDDVATSGATLAEATSVLKKAGARNIVALVAARA